MTTDTRPHGTLTADLAAVLAGLDERARTELARREDAAAYRDPPRPPAVYGRAGALTALQRDLAVACA